MSPITVYESISSKDLIDTTPVKGKKEDVVTAIIGKTIEEVSDETDSEERSHKQNMKKTKKFPNESKSAKPSNGDDGGGLSPRKTTKKKHKNDESSTGGDKEKDNSSRNLTEGSGGAKMKAAKQKSKKTIVEPAGDEKKGGKKKKKTTTKKSQSSKSLGSMRSASIKNSESKLEEDSSDCEDSAMAAMVRPPESTLQERPVSNRMLGEGSYVMTDNDSDRIETSSDEDEVIVLSRKGKSTETTPKKSFSSRRMIKYTPKSERSAESGDGAGDDVSTASSRQSFQGKMEAIRNKLSKMNQIAEKDAKSTGVGQRSSSARVLSSGSEPGSSKRKKKKKANKAKSMRSMRLSGTNDVKNDESSSQVRKKKSKSSRDLKKQSSARKIKNGEIGATKKSKSAINLVKTSSEEDTGADGETTKKKKSKKKTTKKKAASTRQIL
mmetsp:Transcript_50200/g.121637  ORF Transcript_50200/g.121637 Transcript_50200/m.121637 type:complete len:437 (-) Transcript_50200:150-1460(-)